jgi:hypothetical protein
MLKVQIEPSQASLSAIDTRKGTTKGYDWVFRTQHVWIFQPASKFPELFVITLPDDVPFYSAGDYLLDVEAMIVPDSYRSISLSRRGLVLVPVSSLADDTIKTDISKKYGAGV